MAKSRRYTLYIVGLISCNLYSFASSVIVRDTSEPLILTPYIDKGDIELAQNVSRVSLTEDLGFTSHAGFFTVDKKHNSNLYFWYFPAFNNDENAPVVLWLQGGPGASSLLGLFAENGPLIVTENGFAVREHHWALKYHVIYIDNPVGAGFSFTDDGYCAEQQCIAQNLYNCLQQFFLMFPKLGNNELYITGESYAGKYIPSLGMEIHNGNMKSLLKINLKGLALGNALCDPGNQIDYGDYLYQHGMIDDNQKNIFLKLQSDIKAKIQQEDWIEAAKLRDILIRGYFSNTSYYRNFTGLDNFYNYLEPTHILNLPIISNHLNSVKKRSIHVGNLPFQFGEKVRHHLFGDIMKSVAPYISELLSHYRLMFYNGQFDTTVAYPLTVNFLRNLKFSSSDEYKRAPRSIWRVDGEVAGYVKIAGNLTEVLVRNAGHMAPHDQPRWALDLITRFIEKSFK